MRADGARRRRAVVALLAGTSVLAPAAAFGGYQAGQALSADEQIVAAAAPSAPASAAVSALPSPTGRPSELSDAARELAERTTVRLSPPQEPGRGGYSGSGSLVSTDGLILTNAHVAQPTAPGLGPLYGREQQSYGDPDQLVVALAEGDGPAEPAYLADVLVVDGYLDLAVLKVVALADGSPLPAGTTFPAIPLGTVDDLRKGDDLTVLGFPGVTGTDRLSLDGGNVRTFLADPLERIEGERVDIETTADFSGGNSGGLALDNSGRLVGVPRGRNVDTEKATVRRDVRPVDFAGPLLDAARRGAEYVSPYLVAATGAERAEGVGWSAEISCRSSADVLSESDDQAVGHVALTGLADGEDVLLVLRRDDDVVQVVTDAHDVDDPAPCFAVLLEPEKGAGPAPGDYRLEVRVGPEQRLLTTTEITVEPDGD